MKDVVSTAIAPDHAALTSATRLSEKLWFNALWFQTTWFCLVLGRETLLPVSGALLILHLALVRDTWAELLRLSTVAAIGISIDALLSYNGLFSFPGDVLVPLWMCCLWLSFATTLTRSLAWLGRRPIVTALVGAIALPLNYWAGQRLGAVEFPQTLALTLATMSVLWLVTLPLMYRICSLLDRAEQGEMSR